MEIEIINLESNRPENSRRGLNAAIETAQLFDNKISIVVGAKKHYPTSLMQFFLTEKQSDLLKTKEHVVLNNGCQLLLESTNTITKASPTPVLFVVYGWGNIIPKIKRAIGVQKLVVLVPNEEQADIWQNEFNKNAT